jgi:hypothetical protein
MLVGLGSIFARRRSWKSSVKDLYPVQYNIVSKRNNNYGNKSKTLACSKKNFCTPGLPGTWCGKKYCTPGSLGSAIVHIIYIAARYNVLIMMIIAKMWQFKCFNFSEVV